MSESWIIQNLENALEVWNGKLAEIWQLITMSPSQFKGGTIWGITVLGTCQEEESVCFTWD